MFSGKFRESCPQKLEPSYIDEIQRLFASLHRQDIYHPKFWKLSFAMASELHAGLRNANTIHSQGTIVPILKYDALRESRNTLDGKKTENGICYIKKLYKSLKIYAKHPKKGGKREEGLDVVY